MIRFEWKPSDQDWDPGKLAAVTSQLQQSNQQSSFLEPDSLAHDFKPAQKVPYDFFYKFADDHGRESRMRILDWEIGMLYWNCRKLASTDAEALEKVRQRYETEFFRKDLHLFLGTTYEWHSRSPNPWVIIGVFPPPKILQGELF